MSYLSLPQRRLAALPSVDSRFGNAFATFVAQSDVLIRSNGPSPNKLCAELTRLLLPLLTSNAWIPAELTLPAETEYRRECLYEAHDAAFSIGVFTWETGHVSRIHDHHAWTVIGNITGVLRSENFLAIKPGQAFKHAPDDLLQPGEAAWSTRDSGDIHRISVASENKSISIHVYGCAFDAVNRNYYTELGAHRVLRD